MEAQKYRGTIGLQETEREGQGEGALRELEVRKKCNMLSFIMYQCVRMQQCNLTCVWCPPRLKTKLYIRKNENSPKA